MYFPKIFALALLQTAVVTNSFIVKPSQTSCNTFLSPQTRQKQFSLQVAIDTSDIKNGQTIELDGEPFKVINFSVMKQARGAAKMTIKFKNLMRGTTIENTYRSGEKFQTATIEKMAAQFTYTDDGKDNFFFMDSESFEEVMVPASVVDDKEKWIAEGMEVKLVYFKGNVIEVSVPNVMVFEVTETEPNIKGNTSGAHTKPAVLECGAIISVPGFIDVGQKVKVDTDDGVYLERVN